MMQWFVHRQAEGHTSRLRHGPASMMTKVACVIVMAFFLPKPGMAQARDTITVLSDSLTKELRQIIHNYALPSACRSGIKKYENAFLPIPAGNQDAKSRALILSEGKALIAFLSKKDHLQCNESVSKNIKIMASRLVDQLNNFTPQSDTIKSALAVSGDKMVSATDQPDSNATTGPDSATSAGFQGSDATELPETSNPLNTWLIVAVAALSAIVIALLIRNKKSATQLKAIQMKQEPVPEENFSMSNDIPANTSGQDLPGNVQVPEILAPAEDILPVSKPIPFLLSEIMMTAGPRKKFMGEENADKDLGEDVCGFVSSGEKVLLWLLDGTSDLHCLKDPETRREYFSSRLLAVGIAENLKKLYIKGSNRLDAEMVAASIQAVKKEWLEVIEQLPDAEKLLLKANITKKNFPECAATILVVELSVSGDFTAYRSGDSNIYLFRKSQEEGLAFIESSLMQKNDESNDRIFFRLRLDEAERFDIISNEPLHELVLVENINTVICFSDGIGKDTEQLLKEQYTSAPEKTRKEIIYQSQATGDDKSICLIEIRERELPINSAGAIISNTMPEEESQKNIAENV